jgi:integrase
LIASWIFQTCGGIGESGIIAFGRGICGGVEDHQARDASADINGRRASLRGLRHAFGVGSLQAGVPLNLVQPWLGHARMTTTAIYAEASGPEETAFAERLWRRSIP